MYEFNGKTITPPDGVRHDLFNRSETSRAKIIPFRQTGHNPDITMGSAPEDIVGMGGLSGIGGLHPGVLAQADSFIVSDNPLDVGIVEVVGQVEDFKEFSPQQVTLTGDTPILLTKRLTCAYRMRWRSPGLNLGTVTINIDGTDVASMEPLEGSSLMAWYPVRTGFTLYLFGYGGALGAKNNLAAKMSFIQQSNGAGPNTEERFNLHSNAAATHLPYDVPIPVPEKTLLIMRCNEVSGTTDVSAWFRGVLIENQ